MRLTFFHLTALMVIFFVASTVHVQSEDAPAKENGQQGVLVLSDGSVIKGGIYRTQFGYLVKMDTGRRVVPVSQVYLHAESKEAAYEIFSKRSSKINIPARLKLAHWCLENHLLEEAGQELKNVLVLEDNNREAREMLKKLEELLDPENPIHMAHASAKLKNKQSEVNSEDQFLGGLSRELAKTFSAKVQPILLNQCGNSSCHGSDQQKFFLHSGGLRIRRYSELNYQAITNQIDWSHPDQSSLLTAHQKAGGKGGSFKGRSAEKQKELIQLWIKKVAKYKGHKVNEGNQLVQASAKLPEATQSEEPGTITPKLQKVTEEPVLKKVLQSEQEDPFSPDEFNRKYHNQ